FRSNCSYRHHLERWFSQDGAVPGKIFEIESYHGMLACVSAGAGLALMPRRMLGSVPGLAAVRVWAPPDSLRSWPAGVVGRRGAGGHGRTTSGSCTPG